MYEFAVKSKEQQYAYIVISLPILFTILYFALNMEFHLHAFTMTLFSIYTFSCGIGITVGYHRLLTHHSFKANRVLKIILVCLGCAAFEGAPYFWVGAHRYHHQFTDIAGDPHSPHTGSNKFITFVNAHIGWMFNHNLGLWDFNVQDLLKDRDLKFISKHYVIIAVVGLFLPALINWLYYQTLFSFVEGLILCGFVRIFLLHNISWSVNSVCHVFGRRDFATKDKSKNNIICGIICLGEGWHNGHHAFPHSSRHGLLWWQFDISYLMIKIFKLLGLAQNLNLPTTEQIKAKRST